MTVTYVKTDAGSNVLATNSITDDGGLTQSANDYVLDDGANSIQVFFTNYPTSLLEGSRRMFKAYFPRVFLGTGKTRVFKA